MMKRKTTIGWRSQCWRMTGRSPTGADPKNKRRTAPDGGRTEERNPDGPRRGPIRRTKSARPAGRCDAYSTREAPVGRGNRFRVGDGRVRRVMKNPWARALLRPREPNTITLVPHAVCTHCVAPAPHIPKTSKLLHLPPRPTGFGVSGFFGSIPLSHLSISGSVLTKSMVYTPTPIGATPHAP